MSILEYVSILPDRRAETIRSVPASKLEAVETNLMMNPQSMHPDEYAFNNYLSGLDLALSEDGTDFLSQEESLRFLLEETQKVSTIRVAAEAKLKEFQK